ncbi:MAG: Fe-S cluster assembly protein SufB, partial [Gammaproteobacteria bacterium]|nr:Fe-S cluster assembly protein SufB [Gammaproteobacteria bacterium]
MALANEAVREIVRQDYEHGFVTAIDSETLPPGLDEGTVRAISERKGEPEWMLEWRLKAFRHWLTLEEPKWSSVDHPPIDYQGISYYSAPKAKAGPQSLDDLDPELRKTYEKLGIPLEEQKALAGIAVDAVFDSVSVATTFRAKLAEAGVIFCSMS